MTTKPLEEEKGKQKEKLVCAICGEEVETFGFESVDKSLCWSCRRDMENND